MSERLTMFERCESNDPRRAAAARRCAAATNNGPLTALRSNDHTRKAATNANHLLCEATNQRVH